MPVQQQPMAPMPFYADPNRFPTPVWQADPSQGWQGQFIQQLPASAQPIETYQQYPNGIYQATYQQPTFETNTFYTGAVQVLTNSRPPSVPNQQVQLAPPRPNSNYSQHTPSPSPAQQQQQQQQQQSNNGRQYQEYIAQPQTNQQQQNFIPSATTPTGNENSQNSSNSRPGSVNNIVNPPTPNQNFNQQQHQQQQQSQSQQQQQQQQQQMSGTAFTTIANFSPNASGNYVNANSGNAQPGYPQVNSSSPQLTSHNSSGYPGQEQYGGQQWQNDGHIIWEHTQVKMEPGYDQDRQSNQYIQQEMNHSPNKMDGNEVQPAKTFSQADKVNLNTRIKTMILNKQQENKIDETKPVEQQNTTGHFLWYSHHHHLTKRLGVDGGSPINKPDLDNITNEERMETMSRYKSPNHNNYYSTNQLQLENCTKFAQDNSSNDKYHNTKDFITKDSQSTVYHHNPQHQFTAESSRHRKSHSQSLKPQDVEQNRLPLPQFPPPHKWKQPNRDMQSGTFENHLENQKSPNKTNYLQSPKPSDDSHNRFWSPTREGYPSHTPSQHSFETNVKLPQQSDQPQKLLEDQHQIQRSTNLQSPKLSDSDQNRRRHPMPSTPLLYNHQIEPSTPLHPTESYLKAPISNAHQPLLQLSQPDNSPQSEHESLTPQPIFEQHLRIRHPKASNRKEPLPGLQIPPQIQTIQSRCGPADTRLQFDNPYQVQNSRAPTTANYFQSVSRKELQRNLKSPQLSDSIQTGQVSQIPLSPLQHHHQIHDLTLPIHAENYPKPLSRNGHQSNLVSPNSSDSIQRVPEQFQQQFHHYNQIQHSKPSKLSNMNLNIPGQTNTQSITRSESILSGRGPQEPNQTEYSTRTIPGANYPKASSRSGYPLDSQSSKHKYIVHNKPGSKIIQSPLEQHHQIQHTTRPLTTENYSKLPSSYKNQPELLSPIKCDSVQSERSIQIQQTTVPTPPESYPKAPSRNECQPNMHSPKLDDKIISDHSLPNQPQFEEQHSVHPPFEEISMQSPKPSEHGSHRSPLEHRDKMQYLPPPKLGSKNEPQPNLQSPQPSDNIESEPRPQFSESSLEQKDQNQLSTSPKPCETYLKVPNKNEYQPNMPSPNISVNDSMQTTQGHQILNSTPRNRNTENPTTSSQFLSPKLEPTLIPSTPSPTKNVPFKFKGTPISPVLNKQQGMEIPACNCFPQENSPPEPGTYYTHLGYANNLKSLRNDLECKTGVIGDAIRIEKVRYTGKEGKTAQGCPIAKWVLRRQNTEEKYLVIVKHRRGHFCQCAYIVICLVVWDGLENSNADELYSLLTQKLNKFGLPTKRRCATNEPRTCACQGINEETCGASFSFGCSWSMYYNGCKFTRSKEVRKFRLSEKNEEVLIEDKLQKLADHLSPMYKCLAPKSFKNQILFENIASDCRLGTKPGRPFSGVTACVDFCAHAHKDLHNMTNGCTVVVSLTKHRGMTKSQDEQLHVLPLYVADESDEHDSKENQNSKINNGSIEVLDTYPCEVRTCSVPAETCLRRGRKAQEPGKPGRKRKNPIPQPQHSPSVTSSTNSSNEISSNSEIQNEQVSSTVLGYPSKPNWRYDNLPSPSNSNSSWYSNRSGNSSYLQSPTPTLPQFSFFKTPYTPVNNYSDYNQNRYLSNDYYSPNDYYNQNYYYYPPNDSPTPHLSNYSAQFSNYPSYQISNPFDDFYSNNTLLPNESNSPQPKDAKQKVVDISFTDNAECFRDREIGGVAIALQHGSVLFECAKHELHATTALKNPDRLYPTRISLVFYQHRNLNKAQHGLDEYTEKMKRKLELSNGSDLDKSSTDSKVDISNLGTCKDDVLMRAPTLPTMSLTTMFPMYPCIVTGPFREQLP